MSRIIKRVKFEDGSFDTLSFTIDTVSDRKFPLLECPFCHGALEDYKKCLAHGHASYEIIKCDNIEDEILESLETGLKNQHPFAFSDEEMVERIKKYKEKCANFRFKCLDPLPK